MLLIFIFAIRNDEKFFSNAVDMINLLVRAEGCEFIFESNCHTEGIQLCHDQCVAKFGAENVTGYTCGLKFGKSWCDCTYNADKCIDARSK